jgi:hypothetical protein
VRNLKTYTDAVMTGLGDAPKNLVGLSSLKGAPTKKIEELKKFFTKELLNKMDNEDATDSDIQKAVETVMKKLG